MQCVNILKQYTTIDVCTKYFYVGAPLTLAYSEQHRRLDRAF
jgi:hypothetical protein